MILLRTASYVNQVLPKICNISQKIVNRSIYLKCGVGNDVIKINSINKTSRYTSVLCGSFIRSMSSDVPPVKGTSAYEHIPTTPIDNIVQHIPDNVAAGDLLNTIPDAPVPPVPEILDLAAPLAEPTFASLGLGGWSPVGIVQQILEFTHITTGLPWWATIAIVTFCTRILLFPIVILQQRAAIGMQNAMPGVQKIQNEITEARSSGDHFEAAKRTQDLMKYMKEKNCNPMKPAILSIAQAPIFISFFFALKQMVNLPVESLQTGGLFWFTDLTVNDPYYLLPIITCGTIAITMHFGMDMPKVATMGMASYVIRAIPLIVLPFMVNFSSAIVWYWLSTNIFSLMQVGFLRLPAMRKSFKIPQRNTHHGESVLPDVKKFREEFKKSWSNMKMAREMADREQLDNVQFNKAGRGPITKTYVYNPKQKNSKASQIARKIR